MKQTVLIGLGGTGSRVVNNVAHKLQDYGIDINDGIVNCLVLDTNQSDNSTLKNDTTHIPVIATCDSKTIDQYLDLYANREPKKWCPYSDSIGEQTMIDGASEIRFKSRLAFMDTLASSKVEDLKDNIEKVFLRRPGEPEKVRVMIVSSLSGGTGSGMFIQIALWLRDFFRERSCEVNIRGILLLPDIFIKTLDNVRNNSRKVLYHYANAYAAIRELNAIDRALKYRGKNGVTETGEIIPRIEIEGLFDSAKSNTTRVFDNVFFIDATDAGGTSLKTLEAYESTVAQIVYMQLYAPMYTELYSVEDNLYRLFEQCSEPLYGSSGTSSLVYPVNDIATYCALRYAKDAISKGWRKIDAEIEAIQLERKAVEKDEGRQINKRLNEKKKYTQLFEQWSGGKGRGKSGDYLLRTIKNDINITLPATTNNSSTDLEEEETVQKSKVEDYIEKVEQTIADVVNMHNQSEANLNILPHVPTSKAEWKTVDREGKESLIKKLSKLPAEEKTEIENELKLIDKRKDDIYEEIIKEISPLGYTSAIEDLDGTLLGMFFKTDSLNGKGKKGYYVHPIAGRYLLYKLLEAIDEKVAISIDSLRKDAEAGDQTTDFDNELTVFKKEDFEHYFDQTGFVTTKKEIDHYVKKYTTHAALNADLCKQYEIGLAQYAVYTKLKEFVEFLCADYEKLFDGLDAICQKIDEKIRENVKKNDNTAGYGKQVFVYAEKKHKEAQYKARDFDISERNEYMNTLNKEITLSMYADLCRNFRPSGTDNKGIESKPIEDIILDGFTETYAASVRKEVDMDILEAVYKESDFEMTREELSAENSGDVAARHAKALDVRIKMVRQKAKPFLKAIPDEAEAREKGVDSLSRDNKGLYMQTEDGRRLYMSYQTKLEFWGINKDLAKDKTLANTIGSNILSASSSKYDKHELQCYQSLYGVRAEKIAKFNEMHGGDYYTYYSAVINSMTGIGGLETNTPHLDKTWHLVLPYISLEKRNATEAAFYRAFWLGLAYGKILVSQDRFQLKSKVYDSFGNPHDRVEDLTYRGKTIRYSELSELFASLKENADFRYVISKELEQEFNEDLEKNKTIHGTAAFKGFDISDDITNPVTLMVHYSKLKDASLSVLDDLKGALEQIVSNMVDDCDSYRTTKLRKEAIYRELKRIYDKSHLQAKKDCFKDDWMKLFPNSEPQEAKQKKTQSTTKKTEPKHPKTESSKRKASK